MEWTALEGHLRAALQAEPGEHGDDAVEWDHSRYSRALGLLKEPGLHELPHTGCALLVGSPAQWTAAEGRYREWTAEAGWSVLRVSARPTVAVPDPVVHGLAVSICGTESQVLARSGRWGRPALRAGRPRPAGLAPPPFLPFPSRPDCRSLAAATCSGESAGPRATCGMSSRMKPTMSR